MRVELLAHGGDAGDAVALEDIVDLAAGRLEARDETLQLVVLAKLGGDRGQSALQIVLHRKHVAREGGGGIGGRVDLLLLQPAADVLRLGLGIKDVLADLLQFGLQCAQPIEAAFRGRLGRLFGAGFFDVRFVLAHAINLESALAVKSTMGTTRA